FTDRPDLRGYLEEVLWLADPAGLVSLYCSSAYTRPTPGWHRHEGSWIWGALAFIFPRAVARRLLADPDVLAHRLTRPPPAPARPRAPAHRPAPGPAPHRRGQRRLARPPRHPGRFPHPQPGPAPRRRQHPLAGRPRLRTSPGRSLPGSRRDRGLPGGNGGSG